MSPDELVHSGWHDTDGEPVPVRVSAAPMPQAADRTAMISTLKQGNTPASAAPCTRIGVGAAPCTRIGVGGVSPRAMQAAAILGVSIVLLLTAFYVGIDNLRGSLTNTAANVTTVTITQDGHFSPSSIRVTAGSMLMIENKNRDPQVLKAKSGKPLFPVQVLFETPYSFTVPADAAGTYTYVSETLADSETLTITVSASIENAAASAGSRAGDQPGNSLSDHILIPLGDGSVSSAPTPEPSSGPNPPVVPAIARSAPTQKMTTTEHSSDTAIISLGADHTADAASYGNPLPTNPYTVATVRNGINRQAQIASSAKAKLHSGAPLNLPRPRAVSQTGPELWLLLFPAMFALCVVYRRWFVASGKRTSLRF